VVGTLLKSALFNEVGVILLHELCKSESLVAVKKLFSAGTIHVLLSVDLIVPMGVTWLLEHAGIKLAVVVVPRPCVTEPDVWLKLNWQINMPTMK
jgi:hypothetical protein